MNSLKIIFAGTPEFAVPALQALLDSPHQVIAVYTQPDRPAGRGQKLTASPVKQLAMAHDIPIYQPTSLKNEKLVDADLMVVVAYGLLLPTTILTAPRLGCINIHASLLPKWRGAAPIQRAILAGDTQTGITIMQMDAGLDTGPMLSQTVCAITPNETAAQLHDKLAEMGAKALLSTLEQPFNPIPQDAAHASYAKKLTKEEAKIDWTKSAVELDRAIRAFNPWPVAYTTLHGQTVRIWQAENPPLPPFFKGGSGAIIAIDKQGIDVMTGDGILRLLKIQLSGGKPLSIKEYLNANKLNLELGIKLGT